MGLNFTGVTYYDGQGFGEQEARRLQRQGTRWRHRLHPGRHHHRAEPGRLLPRQRPEVHPITYDTSDESAKSLESGRCDVLTSDQSQLYAQRIKLAAPDEYVVLPEVISKEPLGPAVRQGDEEWFDIVRWSLFAQLNAEELGVDSKNVVKPPSPPRTRTWLACWVPRVTSARI